MSEECGNWYEDEWKASQDHCELGIENCPHDESCERYITCDEKFIAETNKRIKKVFENKERLDIISEIQTDRLRELAEAEREGRVVVLPCKVGDTVFVLTADSLDGYEETKINRIVIKKNKIFLNADCKNDDWGSAAWELSPHDFGKKIFLTQAEAERALAATEPKGDAT